MPLLLPLLLPLLWLWSSVWRWRWTLLAGLCWRSSSSAPSATCLSVAVASHRLRAGCTSSVCWCQTADLCLLVPRLARSRYCGCRRHSARCWLERCWLARAWSSDRDASPAARCPWSRCPLPSHIGAPRRVPLHVPRLLQVGWWPGRPDGASATRASLLVCAPASPCPAPTPLTRLIVLACGAGGPGP